MWEGEYTYSCTCKCEWDLTVPGSDDKDKNLKHSSIKHACNIGLIIMKMVKGKWTQKALTCL